MPGEPSPGDPNPSQASRTVSRIMWFFAIVYAVEGIGQAKSGVVWQPLAYFLKQTQGWDAVKISGSLAVLDLPWVIKPLYGAFSDFVPLFGYRRRNYLMPPMPSRCSHSAGSPQSALRPRWSPR